MAHSPDVPLNYDDNGNMIYGPLDGKMTTFTYDVRNRLISAGNQRYEYDAENNRYLRYISGEKAVKFYQLAELLQTINKDRNRYFCKCY